MWHKISNFRQKFIIFLRLEAENVTKNYLKNAIAVICVLYETKLREDA
jgi:hypothetical protein